VFGERLPAPAVREINELLVASNLGQPDLPVRLTLGCGPVMAMTRIVPPTLCNLRHACGSTVAAPSRCLSFSY